LGSDGHAKWSWCDPRATIVRPCLVQRVSTAGAAVAWLDGAFVANANTFRAFYNLCDRLLA
jgi:hypothetical protein